MSDFDASFEAVGAKLPKRFQRKRQVPPQLTFAAEDAGGGGWGGAASGSASVHLFSFRCSSLLCCCFAQDPVYAPECKEEVDPASRNFDQKKMNDEAEQLKDTNNPCGFIFSTPKTKKKRTGLPADNFFSIFGDIFLPDGFNGIPDQAMSDVFGSEIDDAGEGLSWYAWNLGDVDEKGQSGITPKTVKDRWENKSLRCSSKLGIREGCRMAYSRAGLWHPVASKKEKEHEREAGA